MKSQKSKVKSQNTGFTLLLSLLVISIVLVTGLSISGIIMKEIMLSGLGRESQIAFYAADTGMECAFYWDVNRAFDLPDYNINCVESLISGVIDPTSSTTIFTLNLFTNGACAKVKVDKSDPPFTTVESRGYNVGCDSPGPRKVERGLGGRLKKL